MRFSPSSAAAQERQAPTGSVPSGSLALDPEYAEYQRWRAASLLTREESNS
jgi:hypothetical protein